MCNAYRYGPSSVEGFVGNDFAVCMKDKGGHQIDMRKSGGWLMIHLWVLFFVRLVSHAVRRKFKSFAENHPLHFSGWISLELRSVIDYGISTTCNSRMQVRHNHLLGCIRICWFALRKLSYGVIESLTLESNQISEKSVSQVNPKGRRKTGRDGRKFHWYQKQSPSLEAVHFRRNGQAVSEIWVQVWRTCFSRRECEFMMVMNWNIEEEGDRLSRQDDDCDDHSSSSSLSAILLRHDVRVTGMRGQWTP